MCLSQRRVARRAGLLADFSRAGVLAVSLKCIISNSLLFALVMPLRRDFIVVGHYHSRIAGVGAAVGSGDMAC